MEKLYDSGKACVIEVSNFSCKKVEDLLAVAMWHVCLQQSTKLSAVQFRSKTSSISYASQWGNVPLSSPGYSGPSVMSSPIAIFVAESLQKMPAQIALTGGFK